MKLGPVNSRRLFIPLVAHWIPSNAPVLLSEV
jgi:hypothetical protein